MKSTKVQTLGTGHALAKPGADPGITKWGGTMLLKKIGVAR